MAYYILAKYINDKSLVDEHKNYENLKDSFFDYIFLGKGDSKQVAEDSNLDPSLLEKIRYEFCYFYPVDSRHSGRDLVPNHLSFFIFNHVAIFKKRYWPRQIVVNGSVLMEGKKMSKSLGNIIPLRAAIKEYGADSIRLAMLSSAEVLQDADFSFDGLRGIRSKLFDIYKLATQYSDARILKNTTQTPKKTELEDRWLISRLERVTIDTTVLMDKLRVREALHNILYLLDHDLNWYKRRIKSKGREDSSDVGSIMAAFISTRIRLLAPFAPFLCEEVWEKIHTFSQPSPQRSTSILFAGWPVIHPENEDPVAEESELLIMNLLSDIQNILRVTKINPTKLHIYVSAKWKRRIYQEILRIILFESKARFGEIMKILSKDPEIATKAKQNVNLIKKLTEDILSLPIEVRERQLKVVGSLDESYPIRDAEKLFSFDSTNRPVEIHIYREEEQEEKTKNNESTLEFQQEKYDPKTKSKQSRPFKPALYIE